MVVLWGSIIAAWVTLGWPYAIGALATWIILIVLAIVALTPGGKKGGTR